MNRVAEHHLTVRAVGLQALDFEHLLDGLAQLLQLFVGHGVRNRNDGCCHGFEFVSFRGGVFGDQKNLRGQRDRDGAGDVVEDLHGLGKVGFIEFKADLFFAIKVRIEDHLEAEFARHGLVGFADRFFDTK